MKTRLRTRAVCPRARARAGHVSGHVRSSAMASVRSYLEVFAYSRRALRLVWETNARLTVALSLLSVVSGVIPAAIAYVGKLIIDAIVTHSPAARGRTLGWVGAEMGLVLLLAAAQRGNTVLRSLLRVELG